MPISVTCPECQYHFLVGDEFAGRPGRCPECAAVIQVPGPEPTPSHDDVHPDPYRHRAPRVADQFDDFPSRSRRSREVNDWDRSEQDQGDEYDGRQREPRERTFDPQARAAKWESVSRGLRNLMVAVILMAFAEIVSCTFTLVDGVRPGQQNIFGAREKALIIGNTLFSIIAMSLWAMGRIGCARVPYIPARRFAFPAGIIAGLTAACGVLAFSGIVGGLLMAQQNPAGGGFLILLGGCAFLPVLVGFPLAEVLGLVSQVKMATGLRDAAFGRASRLLIVVAVLLTALSLVGMCVFFVFLMGEMQKAQQKQMQQQQQQVQPDQPPKDGAPAPPPGAKGQGKGPGAMKNAPAGQQQPPPEIDIADHPEVVYGITIGRLLVILIYALVSVVCFQLGRSAIRREVSELVGDPHNRDHPHDVHY